MHPSLSVQFQFDIGRADTELESLVTNGCGSARVEPVWRRRCHHRLPLDASRYCRPVSGPGIGADRRHRIPIEATPLRPYTIAGL